MKRAISLIMVPSFATLGILAVFFIAFSTFNIGANQAHADSGSAKASLDIATVLDIAAPSSVTINCTPGSTDASAQLCTSSANISVTTNNLTGYTLQMNTTSGSSNSLTNTAASPAATIPTLSQAYSSANFPVNYWGYTGGLDKSSESGGYNCASNYCPILAYESTASNYAPNHTIKVTDAPANASVTNLTFAGKVNTTKPSGTYSTSVTFTAVANYVPITIMQEFDYDACRDLATDQTTNLTDTRDGTSYTVAKLQDGNCWMTQNLELGTSGQSLNLTNATSNVSSSGYTLTLGTEQSHYKGDTTTKYGNYYTWTQATAGTGTTTAGEDAPNDICPKNWRLPSAGSTDYTASEQYNMINHYISGATWNTGTNPYWSNVTTSQFTNPPVSLVFSGYWSSGSLLYQGNLGYWWSSTSNGSSYAFFLYADSDGSVDPRGDIVQKEGLTVRCLVKPPTVENGMYMQDITPDLVANTPTDVTYTVKDKRDETNYTVAKLQDGNLWMTQNLELGSTSGATALTNELSNVSSSGYSLTPADSTYKGNSNKYGNFYTFAQATAGSGSSTAGVDAQYDICPKGWRLPSASSTSATDSEFYKMLNHYIITGTWDSDYWYGVTTTNFTNAPASLVFSGYYVGSLYDQGNYGSWWSATAGNSNNAYHLYAYSSGYVSPRYNDSKSYGRSIRCLVPGGA